jgi:hypothetical protein
MTWFLFMGGALTGWTLLVLLSSERMRRLADLETERRNAEIEAEKQRQKSAEIPVLR